MPPAAALCVDRLVGGDRVQPRANRPPGLELLALQMHLEEGRLEGVFRHLRIAQVSAEVAIQLALVATDQFSKQGLVAPLAITQQQLLISQRRGLLHRFGRRLWQRGFHFYGPQMVWFTEREVLRLPAARK